MENIQNPTNVAFDNFLKQDYKSCLGVLNKLKSAKTQNEKLTSRIHHNLAIAEFMNGKMNNVNNLLSNLDEVLNETKTRVPTKRKDSTKGSAGSEEELTEGSGAEANDDTLIRYNYAVALNLAGKRNKSIDLMRDVFHSKDMAYDYVSLKNSLTYLNLAITTKDYAAIKNILDFLENIKKNVGVVNSDMEVPSLETDEAKDAAKSDSKKDEPAKKEKEVRHYNPLMFGAEVYKHGEIPLRVCRTEFDFILSIYHIFLLVSLKEMDLVKKKLKFCKSFYNELAKVIKDGKTEKGDITFTYAPAIVPYIDKHASVLFSFTKAYMAYQMETYTKCIKLMNTVEIMTFSDEEAYTSYQLNNIACCHLRMQKFALAAFYFSKALSILQKINRNTKDENSTFKKYDAILNFNALEQYPFILHNYALALSQLEKYDESAEIYAKLAEYWPDNPMVWYRTALCHLNKYQQILENNQNMRRNSLYQSVLDPVVLHEGEKIDAHKKPNSEENGHKDKTSYTRYILHTRDNLWQNSEEEAKLSNGAKYMNNNSDPKRSIDEASLQAATKELKFHLDKAAKCFRNASMIAKKKKIKFQKDQQLQVVLKQNHRGSDDNEETKTVDTNETDEDKSNAMIIKLSRNIKEYQDILQSSLAYLAYTSLCNGEINNAINYSKGCLELNYVSDENKYICFMYLVEAYCLLGKQKEALSQITALNLNQSILTCARNILGVNQACMLKSFSSKAVIYANLASAHLLNNNLPAAQTALDNALANIDPGLQQTPTPLLNIMVYLNLKLDKPHVALQILKRRRIDNGGSNKVILNIVKPTMH